MGSEVDDGGELWYYGVRPQLGWGGVGTYVKRYRGFSLLLL